LRRERPLLRQASTWIDHQALSALFPYRFDPTGDPPTSEGARY
jgi:hypothetical protein